MTLYRIAFDDRNFQVNLNWDRTKHFFVFNVALFTLAGGLAQFGAASRLPQLFLFAMATINSVFAAHSIQKGHVYYRETRKRLKQIEREILGDDASVNVLAMKTTGGMVREMTELPARLSERVTITNLSIVLAAPDRVLRRLGIRLAPLPVTNSTSAAELAAGGLPGLEQTLEHVRVAIVVGVMDAAQLLEARLDHLERRGVAENVTPRNRGRLRRRQAEEVVNHGDQRGLLEDGPGRRDGLLDGRGR